LSATGKKDIKADLSAILKACRDAVKDSNQLDAAERLYGAAIRDDLARLRRQSTPFSSPSQVSLIAVVRDLVAISEKIPVHFQSRFLELIDESAPDRVAATSSSIS
jgi:hypothetical protein